MSAADYAGLDPRAPAMVMWREGEVENRRDFEWLRDAVRFVVLHVPALSLTTVSITMEGSVFVSEDLPKLYARMAA